MFDPTGRNVDPFLFPATVGTMKELVLALTIHDQKITMIKPAPASITVRVGLAIPFEERKGYQSSPRQCASLPHTLQTADHHRCAILPAICLPRQLFRFAAVCTSPSAIALHSPEKAVSSTAPVCGPAPVPCPCEYEQRHEEGGREPTTLCGTILFLPSLQLRREPKAQTLPARHTGSTTPPTLQFSSVVSVPTPNFRACSR